MIVVGLIGLVDFGAVLILLVVVVVSGGIVVVGITGRKINGLGFVLFVLSSRRNIFQN